MNDQLLEKCNLVATMDDGVESPTMDYKSEDREIRTPDSVKQIFTATKGVSLLSSKNTALAAAACRALIYGSAAQNNDENTTNGAGRQYDGFKSETVGDGEGSEELIMDLSDGDNEEEMQEDMFEQSRQLIPARSQTRSFACSMKRESAMNGGSEISSAVVGTGTTATRSQCPKCGKHMRKPRDLITHLATIHKISPAQHQNNSASTLLQSSSSEIASGCNSSGNDMLAAAMRSVAATIRQQQQQQQGGTTTMNNNNNNHHSQENGKNFASELRQIKTSIGEIKSQMNTQKIEQ